MQRKPKLFRKVSGWESNATGRGRAATAVAARRPRDVKPAAERKTSRSAQGKRPRTMRKVSSESNLQKKRNSVEVKVPLEEPEFKMGLSVTPALSARGLKGEGKPPLSGDRRPSEKPPVRPRVYSVLR